MGEAGAQLLLDLCLGRHFEQSADLMPMQFIERDSIARARHDDMAIAVYQ
jgi:hypothetical protein